MEIRVFIVALACLSCLVPPALGMGLVAKAAALGAAKGALIGKIKGAAIGAKIGLAAKALPALAIKKALFGILLKAAALKGPKLLAMKKAAIKGAGTLALRGVSGVIANNGIITALTNSDRTESDCEPITSRSPLMEILSGAARVVQSALLPSETVPTKTRPTYRIISTPPRLIAVSV